MSRSDTKLSRRMCHALRHAPEQYNIQLTSEGWASVNQLALSLGTSRTVILNIVRTDTKGRYELQGHDSQIRAVQGHSTQQVSRTFQSLVPPHPLYHGTATKNLNSIMEDGINPGRRHFVHLSADIDTALSVGQRHGSPIILVIDTAKMVEDGYTFFVAENDVWLTQHVSAEYISTIWVKNE